MQTSFTQLIPLLPEGAIWIIPLSLILLLAGWVSSIAIAVKSKSLALFALFPLTNPIAIMGMIYKNTSKSMIPIGLYALALMVWFTGSKRSYKLEFERLIAYETGLIEQGEPIKASDIPGPKVNPDENAWEHPFLKPLTMAGRPGKTDDVAREKLDEFYEPLQLPKHRVRLKYEETSPERLPMLLPARKLVELSVGIKLEANQATPKEDLPRSPIEAARALEPFFKTIQPDISLLAEAVYRKGDAYPFAWEQGFNLQLPHLNRMRAFSQIAHMDSIMHSTLGHSNESFESARLAFQLSETGDSDILISRLVQMAQQTIALDTLVAAQNHHVWKEAQWIEIRNKLDSINMIQLMPDSLRVERVMGRASIRPLLEQTWSDAMHTIGNLGSGDRLPMKGMIKSALDFFGSNFSGAFLAKQWRLCQEAYSWMIDDLEKAAEASKSQAWKDVQITWDDANLRQYGLFAALLLPALEKALNKAILQQAKLELAKASIDIERYFLKNKVYPENLDALVPDYSDTIPLDPMSGISFTYKQLSKDSFEIYSVGWNGRDDDGKQAKKHRKDDTAPTDDFLWVIGDATKGIPPYTIH